MTKHDEFVASVDLLLAGLRGLAAGISNDLAAARNSDPDKVPAIPLHGRPLLGFAAIFAAARQVEGLLAQVKRPLADADESQLANVQTQGRA